MHRSLKLFVLAHRKNSFSWGITEVSILCLCPGNCVSASHVSWRDCDDDRTSLRCLFFSPIFTFRIWNGKLQLNIYRYIFSGLYEKRWLPPLSCIWEAGKTLQARQNTELVEKGSTGISSSRSAPTRLCMTPCRPLQLHENKLLGHNITVLLMGDASMQKEHSSEWYLWKTWSCRGLQIRMEFNSFHSTVVQRCLGITG